MSYRVKEVSDLVGISVRTLHHYDEIGLLNPSYTNKVGHRFYTEKELHKLQQILFLKELNFSLKEIKHILDNPNYDQVKALEMQRTILTEKKQRMEKILNTIDLTIQSLKGGFKMNEKVMFGAFDMKKIEMYQQEYREEVEKRYGDTNAFKESIKKTSRYSKEDWKKITNLGNQIYKKIADKMDLDPSDEEVQILIKEYREYISDYFYDCTLEIFRGLGNLYTLDERFTINIDKHKTGLAQFLKEAINIYCDNTIK